MIVAEAGGVDDQRIAFPVSDGFSVEARYYNIRVSMLTSIHVDNSKAVHQFANHKDGSGQLNHLNWPHASHHDWHTRRPAQSYVVPIELALFNSRSRCIEMFLCSRSELETRWRIEPFGFPADVQPGARDIERRLRTWLCDVGRRQHTECTRRLELR